LLYSGRLRGGAGVRLAQRPANGMLIVVVEHKSVRSRLVLLSGR
jgi:hypothetical protein